MESLSFGGDGPDAASETAELQEVIRGEIGAFSRSLAGRERVIFFKRLLCEEPATLADIARGFGVSRERVRQIEQRLKDRLRKQLRARVGDPFTGEGPTSRRRYPARRAEA
jgi:RNA polymerase sigma-32 factor